MNLDVFRPLYDTLDEPVLTVCADVSRDSESGDHELRLRWRALREEFSDPEVKPQLDAVEERLLAPTGLGGACGRTVVVRDRDVLLDQLYPGTPRPFTHRGAFPRLTGVLTGASQQVNHIVVQTDRTGADITVRGARGEWAETVEDDAGPVHKANAGGWSEMRWQHTVENAWEQNVVAVAERVDRLANRSHAEVVAVTGDPHSRTLLVDALRGSTRELVHLLDGGGRGEGQEGRLPEELVSVLEHRAAERARAVAALFEQERGREGAAVFGLDATVDALRRAQVNTLLLPPDWSDERLGWYGPEPLLLGLDRAEVDALGVHDPRQAPICDLVVRAATGSDADAIVLPPHILQLHGQPAATLRFTV
jgi:Bacterial archaeo-eukaryotic release factor family 2